MSTAEIEPEPSREETFRYLEKIHPSYTFDAATYGRMLGNVSLIALIGPTAAGKSTLVQKVTELDPEITPMISTMTRAARPNESPYNRPDTPMTTFKEAVENRSVVHYFPSPTGEIYGTFPDGFTAPITIGEIASSTLDQINNIGLRELWPIYTLMSGSTYATRIRLDRIQDPSMKGRIQEGLSSLDFAEDNHDHSWLQFIELDNQEGSLESSAGAVINIARQHTYPLVTPRRRIELINEMRAVLRAAQDRIGV